MEAGRELDALVAEKVMDLRVERIKPDWYPVEVVLFFRPGNPLIEYSYDERSCNAMMHRNGVDDKDGTAPPLPYYSEEVEHAWEVVEHFDTCELKRWWTGARFYWTASLTKHDPEMYAEPTEADTAPLAICLAALAAVGAALPQKAADA